jgi:hypothetical protein
MRAQFLLARGSGHHVTQCGDEVGDQVDGGEGIRHYQGSKPLRIQAGP